MYAAEGAIRGLCHDWFATSALVVSVVCIHSYFDMHVPALMVCYLHQDGKTPLAWAVARDKLDMAAMMQARGAK